jgi:transcription elongation factor Elf1
MAEDEIVRCPKCGAFASSIPCINENSGEYLECDCKKCGLSWREDY